MGKRVIRPLSASECDAALAQHKRYSDMAKKAAIAVLVRGEFQAEFAENNGLTKQLVHKWVSKVYNTHLKLNEKTGEGETEHEI